MPPRSKAAVAAKTDDEGGTTATVTLQRIRRAEVQIPIVGLTPIIPHKWSEKALRMMRDAQSGKSLKAKHDPKVPEDDAEACVYRTADGRPAMPATAFKGAIAAAARLFAGVTMVQLKVALYVVGEGPDQLVPFDFDEQILREDTPRNATGVVDLRYRYAFDGWRTMLSVVYMPSVLDLEAVYALVDAAGAGGVGDWRPSAPKSLTGTFGQFKVADEDSVPDDDSAADVPA